MFNFDEEDDRLITSTKHKEDTAENCLRPKSMDEYIGQDKIKIFALPRWTVFGIKERRKLISKRNHTAVIAHTIHHFQYGCVILVIPFSVQNCYGFLRLI